MRFAGIPASKASLAVVFAGFTFGMLAGSVPVTPGGLGTADAVYIAVMVAGGAPSSAAVAGDLIFRTLTYLLPIPVGAITYVIWRRRKSWLKPVAPSHKPAVKGRSSGSAGPGGFTGSAGRGREAGDDVARP